MIKIYIFLFFTFAVVSTISFADVPLNLNSQRRFPGEEARHAYNRYLERYRAVNRDIDPPSTDTPVANAKPVSELDFSHVPHFKSLAEGLRAFRYVRDLRFINDPAHQNFVRRSTWLYPDDGCFARAALMGQNLEKSNITRPGKIFIFGNLRVKSPNSPTGGVSWWYHVVPIIMIGEKPVIFDPAINPQHPLFLKDWIMTMTGDPNSVKLSVCDPTTYGPSSPCSVKSLDDGALSDQLHYLSGEWTRIVELKRDPTQELGDHPPWK